MKIEDIIKNDWTTLIDRGKRINSLEKKLRAVLFMDLMKKVEALCCDFNKELASRWIYPETYEDWKQIEDDIVAVINKELEKTNDQRRTEELIWSKHFIKYMINIMLIHHLDFLWWEWKE